MLQIIYAADCATTAGAQRAEAFAEGSRFRVRGGGRGGGFLARLVFENAVSTAGCVCHQRILRLGIVGYVEEIHGTRRVITGMC